MKRKINIGNFEAVCIMLVLICTKIVLNFPRKMANDAWTAGWILAIYISILAIIIFYVFLKLFKPFEGKDILDIGKFALGNVGKIFLGLVLISEFMFITAIKLREFSENMKVISLLDTPISIVTIMFCLGMVFTAYFGIEAIARIHGILVPYVVFNFLFILIALIPHYDLSKIAPWFGPGLNQIFIKNAKDVSAYSEFAVLFLLIPFLNKKNNLKKVGRNTLLLSTSFLVLSSLSYLLIYEYPIATVQFLPLYNMTRTIMIGNFFARMESAFMFFWAPVAFAYLGTMLYFIVYIFQKIFNLEYYKPLILPITIIIYTISLLPENLNNAIELELDYFRTYSWIGSFLTPFIFLVIANLKGKKKHKGKRGIQSI